MGRIFETRKHTMFARYDRMAKQFTRFGKEIAIAVKQNGTNPDYNPRLRVAIKNAKSVNMPKDRIDAAIKRAEGKDASSFDEIRYEGYGPHGVGIIVETATDNNTRTVANVRMHFNRGKGEMGKTGSLEFNFTRKGVFTIPKLNVDGRDPEELEFELIDFGLEDLALGEEEIFVYTSYQDFSKMASGLESLKIEPKNAELQYIPNSYVDLNPEQAQEVLDLVDRLEGDEDVQNVYHNLK